MLTLSGETVMQGPIQAHLLDQMRGDLHETRQALSRLNFKVNEIGAVFADSGLREHVASIKPWLILLALQGFANIVLLAAIALR